MLTVQAEQIGNSPYGRAPGFTAVNEDLLDKLESRQANVAIIGLGYVGLPLAVAFAEAGFSVTGVDIDAKRVARLNEGYSHVSDVPAEQIAPFLANARKESARHIRFAAGEAQPGAHTNGAHANGAHTNGAHTNGHAPASSEASANGHEEPAAGAEASTPQAAGGQGSFRATTDYDALYDMDAVIICVPTPLSRTKDPDMSYIITATDEIARRLHHGMLIVLESTTYPGTTEEIVLPRLQRVKVDRATLAVGADFFLAFSPERIDPGRTDWTVHTTPKVIGGITPRCLAMAQTLYSSAIKTVVPVSKTTTAEMVKLLENTFRAVNIALINEVAIMCDRLGVDVWEVVEAAKTKPFGYMPFYPGPGLGGHCIPIDPRYLAWKMKTLNYNARFIQLAEEVNFGMPEYVIHKIAGALNELCKSFKGSQILLLGVTYKADISDLRESPALDIMHILHERGASVAYHDPYAPRVILDGWSISSVELTREVLQAADCVVITTAHTAYDWQWVADNSRLIVDTRNVTAAITPGAGRIVKI